MFNKKFALIALILCIVLTVGYFAVNTEALSTVLLAIQGAITDGNLVKFSGTNGIGVDTGLSATNVVKCKFDATIAPTINNDVSEGYTVGSRWLDITNLKSYVCLDNTDGAAVWIENVVEGDMNKSTYDADEDGDIDVAAGGTEKSVWTQYAIPYLSDTTTFGEIPIGTAEYALTVNAGANGYDFTLFDLSLYYLKTEIDTQGEVETIWGVTLATDTELAALKFTDLDDTPANYTGQAGKYVKVNVGETALEFGTPESAGDMTKAVYDIDTDNIVDKAETVDDGVGNSSTAADVKDAVAKKHSQNADTDLDPTFEATFVKKVDTVNVLSDITSAGSFIEDAVTERHIQNTDTALGTQTEDLNMGTHKIIGVVDPVNPQEAATKAYADTKVATEVDPTVDEDSELKAILVDEVIKTGAFTAGRIAKINNATGIIEQGTNTDTDVADAVTKKHSQNTDTTLVFTNALASDHTYSGEVDSQPVGESVVFGDLLYFNWTDKEWKKTDADATATVPGLRIALETKSDGQACLMLVKGYIRDDSAFEFAAAMVYTSVTPGAMSSTAPTETGDQLQRVGQAKSADILFFDPSIDVGEI